MRDGPDKVVESEGREGGVGREMDCDVLVCALGEVALELRGIGVSISGCMPGEGETKRYD